MFEDFECGYYLEPTRGAGIATEVERVVALRLAESLGSQQLGEQAVATTIVQKAPPYRVGENGGEPFGVRSRTKLHEIRIGADVVGIVDVRREVVRREGIERARIKKAAARAALVGDADSRKLEGGRDPSILAASVCVNKPAQLRGRATAFAAGDDRGRWRSAASI